MISKDLLSAVLPHHQVDFVEVCGTSLCYNNEACNPDFNINIHELTHKCKEWGVKQGYGIKVEPWDYMEDGTFFSGTYWGANYIRPGDFYEKCSCPNCGANKTEPEAIFTACEWVLKQTKQGA